MSATRDHSSPRSTPQPVLYHHTVDTAVETSDLPGNNDRDVECGTYFENNASERSNGPSRGTKRLVWITFGLICVMCLVALGIYYAKHSDKAHFKRKDEEDDKFISLASIYRTPQTIFRKFDYSAPYNQSIVPALPKHYMLANNIREQFIQPAVQWRTAYKNNANVQFLATYSTKAIKITNNVFSAIQSHHDHFLMDTGFGIVERTYSAKDLNSVDVISKEFKSTFEFKHFYAFYSILDHFDYKNSTFTCHKLFGLESFYSSDQELHDAGMIILDLLGCSSNGNGEKVGLDMIASVLNSDLYQALVSMFAKAAIIEENTLVVSSESLHTRFPMWFPTQSIDIEKPMEFKAFAAYIIKKMRSSLYSISVQVQNELLTDNKLQSVLQLALISIHYNFAGDIGNVAMINSQIGKDKYTSPSGVISYEEFLRTVKDGIPVFPDTKEPLLPDAPDKTA